MGTGVPFGMVKMVNSLNVLNANELHPLEWLKWRILSSGYTGAGKPGP